MSKPKIMLLGKINQPPAQEKWNALSSIADIIHPKSTNRSDFLHECSSGAFTGVIACYRTFTSTSITGRWDAELVSALPDSWEFVSHMGAGYDQIDVQACSERRPKPLKVSNTPGAVDDSTADTAVFLMLGALRGFNTGMRALREGEWRGVECPFGRDPEGKTLGILGMGGIGRNLSKKCAVFGMKTIYHNRNKLSDEEAAGAEYVSFDELLVRSDVLSLNLPLNKNTRHIISTPEFAKMKRGIIIINTARGAVIDEAALVEALASGQVGSVGLDVYENEPEIHPGLLSNRHVMLLPHMGTWSVETETKMEELVVENVRSAIERGKLVTPVPEQADL